MKTKLFRVSVYVAFIALTGYFIAREITSPWIFKFGGDSQEISTASSENEQALANSNQSESLDIQSNLNDSLAEAYALLSTNLEDKLQDRIVYLQKINANQQVTFSDTKEAVLKSIDGLMFNAENSIDKLATSIRGIRETQAQVEAAKEDLDKAQENLIAMSSSINELQSFTQELMDERNYDFKAYKVGPNESLSEIVARLQNLYKIPQTDLRELVVRFNTLQTRLVPGGNKRPDVRVVINESIRIPIPKSTGTLLDEREVPKQLEAQIVAIKRAKERYTSIQTNLKRQINHLQKIDNSIQAMRNLATGINEVFDNVDFASDSWISDQSELSPEQRQAWEDFDDAIAAFNFTNDLEEKNMARKDLEKATQNLIRSYASPDATPEENEDPLLWYNRFLNRYFPEEDSSKQIGQ